MAERPEVLIEKWFPVDIIGAESMRERGASSALPPLYFLHVWWARRPLTASRASILASVLPTWSPSWPNELLRKFQDEETYLAWFLKLCGIYGDPVAGRKLSAWARDKGIRLQSSPYSHKRAFTINPSEEDLETFATLMEHTWGKKSLKLLDPFSGGGSIPMEAVRYGFQTFVNELNPVASVILRATLEYPALHQGELAQDISKYGTQMAQMLEAKLAPYFPVQAGERIHAHIWARTVNCPYTGKPIPLTPNWWLSKSANIAVRACL